ncbi:hypothetical protein DFH07DRAFT_1067416 [Mycena maculata]|uniref:Uncharacterized protein n=1 Tax=Mycena maculata TaxID=230809 RepID=A0AAD7HL60_9AGAR|nr:hypothetical protein DFH07DRAFT_1067416 [Mycena maculata]
MSDAFNRFMKVIRDAKCRAVDTKGNKCRGGPILKPKPHGSERNHQYFVGCSGWTPKFQQGHRTHPIPDNVDEDLLANALAGRPLTDDPAKDTLPCSGIIHPHTGLKKKYCSHAHIVNGIQVRGEIKNYPCKAVRYVYVPKDPSIRKVLIVHNNIGHTHPIPTLSNVSFELNDTYRQCIKAHGVLGATVSKIDNAQSTKMLRDGKTPSAYAPPLHNKRVKRERLNLPSHPPASIQAEGSDTASSQLQTFLVAMSLHPEVQAAAQKELAAFTQPSSWTGSVILAAFNISKARENGSLWSHLWVKPQEL